MKNSKLARESFRLANEDYISAKFLFDNLRPMPIEIICYHAQQAVEKSLKAVLYSRDNEVEDTHSIPRLLNLVNKENLTVDMDIRDARRLTRFATTIRYADRRIDVTKEDAELGLKYAKQVLDQVEKALNLKYREGEILEHYTEVKTAARDSINAIEKLEHRAENIREQRAEKKAAKTPSFKERMASAKDRAAAQNKQNKDRDATQNKKGER